VLGDDGRLFWMMDGLPLRTVIRTRAHYSLGEQPGQLTSRNSVKVVVDAYNGTTDFYVFDDADRSRAYRKIFPSLFKGCGGDAAGLRKHVRYPEMLFKLQAEVYGSTT